MLDRSIHPRNWPDQTPSRRNKSNTRRQPTPGTRQRAMEAITAHLSRHPHDGQSVKHLASLQKKA